MRPAWELYTLKGFRRLLATWHQKARMHLHLLGYHCRQTVSIGHRHNLFSRIQAKFSYHNTLVSKAFDDENTLSRKKKSRWGQGHATVAALSAPECYAISLSCRELFCTWGHSSFYLRIHAHKWWSLHQNFPYVVAEHLNVFLFILLVTWKTCLTLQDCALVVNLYIVRSFNTPIRTPRLAPSTSFAENQRVQTFEYPRNMNAKLTHAAWTGRRSRTWKMS